jgi:hypothetical protein
VGRAGAGGACWIAGANDACGTSERRRLPDVRAWGRRDEVGDDAGEVVKDG